MVYKRSEYRRAFLRSPTKFLSEDFEQKYDYRSFRRQVEHQHHSIDWETLSAASSDTASEFVIPSPRVPGLQKVDADPPHIQKFKAFKKYWADKQKEQVEEKRVEKQEIKDRRAGKVDCKKLIEEKEFVIDSEEEEQQVIGEEDDLKIENLDLHDDDDVQTEEEDGVEKNEDKKAIENIGNLETQLVQEEIKAPRSAKKNKQKKIHVTTKPRRPYLYKKIPKCRPISAPACGKTKNIEPEEIENRKPLFVAWGAGDKEIVVGDKKTHNVRCSVEVHAAALRAAKRRQDLTKQKKSRGSKSSSRNSKRTEALFDELMNRETSNWDTEYRRNFTKKSLK